MARTAVQAENRRSQLQTMLAQGHSISVTNVARDFGVNPMTIRRDLKLLEQSGLLVRCYGGAVAAQRVSLEFEFDERYRKNLLEKARIGQAAASLVKPGQTVTIDTGTTTLEIAKALVARNIECTVITSSLVIASVLWGNARIQLWLVGGRVRPRNPDLVGPMTELALDRVTADIAFLGAEGIDPDRGCFNPDLETARVAEKMAAHAHRIIVASDSSKLGMAGPARFYGHRQPKGTHHRQQRRPKNHHILQQQGVTVTCV